MLSGMIFCVNSFNVQLLVSLCTISTIFFLIARICAAFAYVVFLIWFGRRRVKAMTKMRSRYSSVVLMTTLPSISVCHLRTRLRSLSDVNSRP